MSRFHTANYGGSVEPERGRYAVARLPVFAGGQAFEATLLPEFNGDREVKVIAKYALFNSIYRGSRNS